MGTFSENFAKWRSEGPLRGSVKAARLPLRRAHAVARAARIARRPLRVGPDELAAALGGRDPVEVLRGRVLEAIPTVARFERSLDELPEEQRQSLTERARRICAHDFDLLGSGPTPLGAEIDWSRDFKSGRRWPPVHISRFVTVYPDDSDVKVPWELSRFQHLPVLAAAARLTGDRAYLDEIGAQLDSWIEANPVEIGPTWGCTMDVAIRAANWIAALAMCAEHACEEPWFERVLSSILLHGRFIRSHPEYGEVRGNHYLSDVVGLLAVACVFADGSEGREWAEWGAGELECEMAHQVHPDGVDHEASIPYHRLVAELFICGEQIVDRLLPGALSGEYRLRLDAMLRFTADYERPDGLAPQIGDADDGRFLPLGDYAAADPRRHGHLFAQRGERPPAATPDRSTSYSDGGFHLLRAGELWAIVRAGDTGMRGRGGHAHNDQLSFELSAFGTALVVDPGSFIYTASPSERNLFRSTAFHSTLQVDGAEQNELDDSYLFSLPDRTRTQVLEWDPGAEHTKLLARHFGFCALLQPALHTRRFDLSGERLLIEDEIDSVGEHDLKWTFPLAGGRARIEPRGWRVELDRVVLSIESPAKATLSIEPGWISPAYGVRERVPFLRASARSQPGVSRWRFELRPTPLG